MVGDIYITMMEREGRMYRVIGNPRMLVAHILQ